MQTLSSKMFKYHLKNIPILPILTGTFAHKSEWPLSVWEGKGWGQRSMLGAYQSTKLPFYLGYIIKANEEVKCQGQRARSQVSIKGWGQRLMSRSNVWHRVVDKVTNQVLTFLGLNKNEKKKKKKKKHGETIKGPTLWGASFCMTSGLLNWYWPCLTL